MQIVLPEPAAAGLHELADAAEEPVATLAARIIRDGVARAAKNRAITGTAAPPAATVPTESRPPWLEPYGGDEQWRREMWGAIAALHGRYPRHLGHLKNGWWQDERTIETLCALAVWRSHIDQHGHDPREELAFQHQLANTARTLYQQGGGIEKTWHPGAPPEEWIVGYQPRSSRGSWRTLGEHLDG